MVACRGLNMEVKLPREKACSGVRITGCFVADCGDSKLNPSPGGHLYHLRSQLPLLCLIIKRRTPPHTHAHTQKKTCFLKAMKVKRKLEKHIVFTHPTFTLLFLQFDPVQFCDFFKF